jgi:hypothetical protein
MSSQSFGVDMVEMSFGQVDNTKKCLFARVHHLMQIQLAISGNLNKLTKEEEGWNQSTTIN